MIQGPWPRPGGGFGTGDACVEQTARSIRVSAPKPLFIYTRRVLLTLTDMACSYNRKPFLEALGNVGLCKLLEPYEDKSAEAVCTLGYSPGPESEPMIFQGKLLVCIALSIHEAEILKMACTNFNPGPDSLTKGRFIIW